MTRKEVMDILDQYGLEGTWSGGNDSGGIDSLQLKNKEVPPDILLAYEAYGDGTIGQLIGENSLDEYGGWAWNFYAHGTIEYNKDTKTIIVSGTHTEEDEVELDDLYDIWIWDAFTPEDLKRIDSVNIFLASGDAPSVRINIVNGLWTDSLDEAERKILKVLEDFEEEWDPDIHRYYVDTPVLNNRMIRVTLSEVVPEEKSWLIDLKEEEVNYE